jgi:ATP-dependent helicase/nuclease subunit A
VRQRGALFEAIIRALKDAQVAVAGADRLLLADHIAVMDLMVLADALLLPSDDLALATVLKSPLFGFDDEDLFALAFDRPGTLRRALEQKAETSPRYAAAVQALERWELAARHEPPFAFYARVLGADRGRARLLARLGPEAADALDEFLSLALDYESRETPSLQGFVAWLRATRTEVKRDMEIARDEVRVMTVHGAKGLEAPIVVLADTVTNPAGPYPPRLLKLASGIPGGPERIVWAGAKETDVPPVADARARAVAAAQDEYRRLLYVAMTRAADRLIVCGATGQRRRPEGCWYDLIRDALEPIATKSSTEDGEVLCLRTAPQPGEATGAVPAPQTASVAAPDWLTQSVEIAASATTVRPSATTVTPTGRGSRAAAADRQRALARGTLVHRLIQSLPDVALERRPAAARRYLERAAAQFTEVERERLVEQVMAVLADPRLVPLCAPGSRAEVPIVGRIARSGRPPLAVSGQIDRLALTDEVLWIADYKTDSPAPRRLGEVSDSYLGQLALYRAVLAQLYPDKAVRAALIWTDLPDFMEISSMALDAALARVGAR